MTEPESCTNRLGMKMRPVLAGQFEMGSADGEFNERPVHSVCISQPFFMSATPVTNVQYEAYDSSHRALRGKNGLSNEDNEAVIFVSWHNAVGFCEWLSEKEGRPYRLPTEAEWEFACRAGTCTPYHSGEELPELYHRAQGFCWEPVAVDLRVGTTPPNAWGLYDMHGLVEEWCLDWHGDYPAESMTDPVGPVDGVFRVTRGGSHNTGSRFLRSACRTGTLPEDRSWAIGFRVVQAPPAEGRGRESGSSKAWQRQVAALKKEWTPIGGAAEAPVFSPPQPYVIPPAPDSGEPFYRHNHCPSIAWCDNGDLLAIWFSTISEGGREMTILASRRRAESRNWEPASEFFNAPGRNMTGSSLFNDGEGTLFHFNGLGVADAWAELALVMRNSRDNGVTWSKPLLIDPEHRLGNQVISGTSLTGDKMMIQPCDAVWSGSGGTVIHTSRDGGRTWANPADQNLETLFRENGRGNRIAGIHAGVVSLKDGRLMALGRSNDIDERMPLSLSDDGGCSWKYNASEFPPISGGQRLVLMRLREGPILLITFTDDASRVPHSTNKDFPKAERVGMVMRSGAGDLSRVFGMFAALSYDEGQSWPVKKLIAPASGSGTLDGGGWTGPFTFSPASAEPKGYLAATQSPDGLIHLVSSRLYYRFNLAWIEDTSGAESS